jgi:hypothetical protein
MKLNRLKSIANQVLRDSIRHPKGHFIDPFYHYTPEFEILIDLKRGTFVPELEDDVRDYYNYIINWFHNVLKKEDIPIEVITKAILRIDSKGKVCIIKAQDRIFKSSQKF